MKKRKKERTCRILYVNGQYAQLSDLLCLLN